MSNPWVAALIALFAWWFSTGAILWRIRSADNGGAGLHLWSVLLSLPLLFFGVMGALDSRFDPSVSGVYLGFFAALALWGWIEIAFLSGVITGPNHETCPESARKGERFLRAVGTIAWHELLLIVTLALLGTLSEQASNAFAFWTFALLFSARLSAKLNLFFGVPRINTQFLPRPLTHLASHFRQAPVTGFFPFTISVLTIAAALLGERLWNAPTTADSVGFALLLSMLLLALLEHWFMVLPLPDEKLWRWMIPDAKPPHTDRLREDANGL
ncbi:MAG: putative photosynthetic complex assembly protein PuhE [Pseudorhodobacter sp.]|nr:putative photosynthetic complex assembly protein PuhE [Pseudorhodobacter sp.]